MAKAPRPAEPCMCDHCAREATAVPDSCCGADLTVWLRDPNRLYRASRVAELDGVPRCLGTLYPLRRYA
jgi:hypothetical protein